MSDLAALPHRGVGQGASYRLASLFATRPLNNNLLLVGTPYPAVLADMGPHYVTEFSECDMNQLR